MCDNRVYIIFTRFHDKKQTTFLSITTLETDTVDLTRFNKI